MQQKDIRDAGTLLKDLNRPRQSIYWIDLGICIAIAATGLYQSRPFPDKILDGSAIAATGLIVAAFALYRASYFNHELAHHPRDLRTFGIAWNLWIGIPLLIPSYLYTDHLNHHSVRNFATKSDTEYFAPGLRGIRGTMFLLLACFLLPIAYVGRFLLLPPVAWFSPAVRRYVDTRMSSLGILGLSKRKPPIAAEIFAWRLQEFACFVYLIMVGTSLATGLLTVSLVLQSYTVIFILLFLHGIRIMAGHRYEVEGSKDRIEQVLDSFNFTGNPIVTRLMAPLGFHLHALHHLFPKIPYHNMEEAHRRISAALPPGSFYHIAEAPSYFQAVGRFMIRGLKRPRRGSAMSPEKDNLAGGAAVRLVDRFR